MMKNLILSLISLSCIILSANAQSIKIANGPYLQNVYETEATIVWTSDVPSIGWVELAPDGDDSFYAEQRPRFFDASNGIKNTSCLHHVTLKGLTPGTTYRYRVYSQAVTDQTDFHITYGNYAATNVYTKLPLKFTTADSNKDEINFVMVNDIHGRNDALQSLIGCCDMSRTDLVLFNGDMSSILRDENDIFGGFMDMAINLFASETPMYYTRGNHETRGKHAPHFKDYFSQAEDNIYFAFRQGPVYFVILDTGEDKPDNDIEYYGINLYDEYRTEQALWLKQILDSEEYRSAPFKVVVAHIPPIGDWHGTKEVYEKFISLLQNAQPDIMLCGHLHQLVYREADDKIPFPILVNSNNHVVTVKATPTSMHIQVKDPNGTAKTITLQ